MVFETLAKCHDRTAFDCGNIQINQYLQTIASQHHKKDISKIHVLTDNQTVIAGFYSLSNGQLDNTKFKIKGYPNVIPVVLIGRMGVSMEYQGQNLSKKLLLNALHNIKRVSLITGVVFAMIEAKDIGLARYYESLGFERLPNTLNLLFPVNKIELPV